MRFRLHLSGSIRHSLHRCLSPLQPLRWGMWRPAPSLYTAPTAALPSHRPSSSMGDSSPPPLRGAFILLEGLDRSGKTTQCQLLAQHLNSNGPLTSSREEAAPPSPSSSSSAVLMRFPDRTTAVGAMIDAYLKKATELDDHAVHLLFSANRWEARSTLLSHLRAGRHVVVDRYSYSGAAFTSAKGLPLDWTFHCELGLPAPDVTIFLSISPADAAQRGGFGLERYETDDMQRRVREQFRQLQRVEVGKGRAWKEVEAGKGRTVAEVAVDIRAIAEHTIARVRHSPIDTLT